jgi:hypothetical protein
MVRVPGSHAPNIKNRSSKHLICMTKMRPIVRTMSNAALNALGSSEARSELQRRQKKREKREAKVS